MPACRQSVAASRGKLTTPMICLCGVLAMTPACNAADEGKRPASTDASAAAAPAADTRDGEDWPQFLGPRGDGTSTETGLIDSWGDDGPVVLWTQKVGTGYSAPSVRDGRLVLHHRVRDDSIIECVDAATGTAIWKYAYDTKFSDPYGYNNGPRCSPLLTDEYCYTFGAEGKLLCLKMADGTKIWERDTNIEWSVPQHFFGVGCTPILEGGKLIVLVGGQPNSAIVAFDPLTGKTLWENIGRDTWNGVATGWSTPETYEWSEEDMLVSYSSPIAATIHGKRHVFCLLRQGLVSINPDDGSLNFKYWFRSRTHESVNAARPLVVDDLVFISAVYKTGSALLQVAPSGTEFKVLRREPRGLSTHWSTVIYNDGLLYGFDGRHEQEGTLQCVDLSTGEKRWGTTGFSGDTSRLKQDRTTGAITDSETGKVIPWPFLGRGSATLADGKLIILGERGTLALAKPSADEYVELCRTSFEGFGYPSWTAPVLSHKRLYIRSEKLLICLDFAADQKSP